MQGERRDIGLNEEDSEVGLLGLSIGSMAAVFQIEGMRLNWRERLNILVRY
jgi:hypothetical protein